MQTKIKFQDLINDHSNDVRLSSFPFIMEAVLKLDKSRINFDISFVEVENYNEPSEVCNIYFFPNEEIKILPMHIWLDKSFQTIYVGFENFGEHMYLERIEDEPYSVYEKCFKEITSLKYKKEYYGVNNLIRSIVYKGFYENEVYSIKNTYRFTIKQEWFWQKSSTLLKEEFYESIF